MLASQRDTHAVDIIDDAYTGALIEVAGLRGLAAASFVNRSRLDVSD
ncbi:MULTISPECIES: hypothetical protein [Agrobacterium]|nr:MULTISPECIES: hypothetical protein [Agrobacterium]MVA52625.1 hypothetical protein [Agrobacterium vitis]MVA63951.1 hypothetical protein [Agrobacterium vitis]NTZ63888.1 hypothetical protein [Agrobacterium tumefaciens]UXT00223.1 hypothetical protein FY143_25735 [Agrobacterium tumefaciens]UXT52923.1 hypothetical protein FY136_27225 [Agrobacterium tumefaciens]